MRTTVTLDDDLAHRLRDFAHRSRLPFKVALNAVLRRGLSVPNERAKDRKPFRVLPQPSGFRTGVDRAKLNQLVDQMEVAELGRKSARLR